MLSSFQNCHMESTGNSFGMRKSISGLHLCLIRSSIHASIITSSWNMLVLEYVEYIQKCNHILKSGTSFRRSFWLTIIRIHGSLACQNLSKIGVNWKNRGDLALDCISSCFSIDGISDGLFDEIAGHGSKKSEYDVGRIRFTSKTCAYLAMDFLTQGFCFLLSRI